jgi:hypothetical protein
VSSELFDKPTAVTSMQTENVVQLHPDGVSTRFDDGREWLLIRENGRSFEYPLSERVESGLLELLLRRRGRR